MGDTELVLSDRGRLENMSVSSFGGHTDDIPDGAVEVRVHAVSLNFKDMLNVLVPDTRPLHCRVETLLEW